MTFCSRLWRVTVLGLVLGLLFSSCGGTEGELTGVNDALRMEDDQRQRHLEIAQAVESDVADCMADRGFPQYVADIKAVDVDNAWLMRAPVLTGTDDEFTEQFGYGLTAFMSSATHLVGEDPNHHVFWSLSQSEQQAWNRSYESCIFGVREAWGIDLDRYLEEVLQQVGPAITDLDFRILNHPRVSGLTTAWVTCMGTQGFTFSSLTDPRDTVEDEMNRLMEELWWEPDETEVRQALVGAQVYEVEVAGHDVACRQESGVDVAIAEVREELEAEFMSQHRELLEVYRAGLYADVGE